METEITEKQISFEIVEEELIQKIINFDQYSVSIRRDRMNRVLPQNAIWMMEEF